MSRLRQIQVRAKLAWQVFRHGPRALMTQRDIPAISPEEVAEAQAFFPMDKFFVFGHARSGTTLLARLIRVHPEVHCNYQAHFFTRPPLLQALVADPDVAAWLQRPSNRWSRGRDLSPVVLRAVADFILERDARREGKRIVGDKSPNSLLNGQAVRHLHAVYPDARLIFIVRDGRDAVLSQRFQSFIDAVQHLTPEDLRIREDFAKHSEVFFRGERSVFTEKGLRRAAENWVQNVTETHRLGQELYGDRYHVLRYEDLLARPWEEMQRLWVFLGAPTDVAGLGDAVDAEMQRNPDADWQRYKEGDLVANLKKGKAGSWRELFTERDRALFHEIAADTLREWGYEVS